MEDVVSLENESLNKKFHETEGKISRSGIEKEYYQKLD